MNIYKAFLGVAIMMLAVCGQAQNIPGLVWAVNTGGIPNEGTSEPYDMATDADQNTYVAGRFTGTIDLDPSSVDVKFSSAGSRDIFIAKYDKAGKYVWGKSIGGADVDEAKSIHVDAKGDVFVTGLFEGTVDFDPGVGEVKLESGYVFNGVTFKYRSAFVLKLDANGEYAWAVRMGVIPLWVDANATGQSVYTDVSGNVLVAGFFSGEADFDPSDKEFRMQAAGQTTAFVAKLTSSGQFVWAKSAGTVGGAAAISVVSDEKANVYVSGNYRESIDGVDFDPSDKEFKLGNTSDFDVFVWKLNDSGDFVWAKQLGGDGTDYATSIALDKQNNVYTTGYFRGTADFDPSLKEEKYASNNNSVDFFVSKLDTDGNHVWAKAIGGRNNDYAYHAIVSPSQELYLTGTFGDSVDFDPGTKEVKLGTYSADYYVLKLKLTGEYGWAYQVGGKNQATTSFSGGISADVDGNIILVDNFGDLVDLDPTICLFEVTPPVSTQEFFIQKVNEKQTPSCVVVTSVTKQPADTAVCAGASAGFSLAATGTNLTYLWQFRSASSNVFRNITVAEGYSGISTAQLAMPKTTSGMVGNYRCLVLNGTDTIFSNTVTLTINAFPAAPTILTPTPEACDTSFTLQVQGAGNYTWSRAGQVKPDTLKILGQMVLLLGQTSVTVTQVSNFKQGANNLYLTTRNTLCARRDSITLLYYPNEKPVLSSNAVVGDSVRLTAQPVVRGNTTYTGTWSTSGAAVIKNPTLASTVANKLTFGLNKFYYTLNNLCKTRDSISVNYSNIPKAVVGKDSSTCGSDIMLKASPVTQSGYRGFWRMAGKKANGIIIADTTMATTTAKLSFGANQFIWTVTNGQISSSDTVVYTRRGTAIKPVVSPISGEACSATQALQFATNSELASYHQYKWTRAEQSGVDTLRIVSTQSSFNPQTEALLITTTVTNFKAGINRLVLTTTSTSLCPVYDTLSIYPSEKPVLSSNPVLGDSVRLTAQPVVVGNVTYTGTWSTKGIAIIKNPTLASTVVNKLAVGTNKFVYTLNDLCKTRDSISIIRSTVPGVPVVAVGQDSTTCDSSIILKATPVTQAGFRGFWRISGKKANGIIITDTTKATTSAKLSFGVNAFIWTVTNGEFLASDTVRYTRSTLPNKPTIASVSPEACGVSQVLQIGINTNDASNKYKWTRVGAQVTDTLRIISTQTQQGTQGTSNILTTVGNYKTGTNTLLLTTTNASQCVRTDQATLSYFPNEKPSVGADISVAADSVPLTAQPVVRGNVTYAGTWRKLGGIGVFKDSTQNTTVARKLTIGANVFVYRSKNPCQSSDTVRVTYLPAISVSAGQDRAVCFDTLTLAATAVPQGYMGVWRSANKTLVFTDSTKINSKLSQLPLGVTKIVWLAKSGNLVFGTDTLVLTRNELPKSVIPAFKHSCTANASFDLFLETGESITFTSLGTASIIKSTATPTRYDIFNLSSFPSVSKFRWTLAKASCTRTDTLDYYLANAVFAIKDPEFSGIAGDTIKIPVSKVSGNDLFAKGDQFDSLIVEQLSTTSSNVVLKKYAVGDTVVYFVTNKKLQGKETYAYRLRNGCGVVSDTALLVINARNVRPNASQKILQRGTDNILRITIPMLELDSNRYLKTITAENLPLGIQAYHEYTSSDSSFVTFVIDISKAAPSKEMRTISFRLCDQESSCDVIKFLLPPNKVSEFTIYNALSPNGDGKNDVFELEAVEELHPKNKVQIFNRWGDKVFEVDDYNNKDRAFDGADLPDGTYYYMIKLEGESQYRKGFIVLKR
jgi:gliding motility-associated-like protein